MNKIDGYDIQQSSDFFLSKPILNIEVVHCL